METPQRSILKLFRHKATRYAYLGALIAFAAVILATLLLCVLVYDGITPNNIILSHRENIAMWFLDAMPFAYALWGQYASVKMTHEAGSLVSHQTSELQKELREERFTTQAKTDFFARMSHELRTPINAIIGMSESLIDANLDDRHRRNAQIVHESAHDLLTLVNDVLDLSKIESGRMELDSVDFDLRETLENSVSMVRRLAEDKDLRLMHLVPRDMPRQVTGDPGRLRQILLNLLSNAVKYTEQGEIVLAVRDWQWADDAALRLEVEVADTGVGLSETEQKRIFQPYAQGRTKGRQRQDSTGLGLSIAGQLVEAMGGEISVESEPGGGSAFRFSVELVAAARPVEAESETMPDLRGRHVLLAEAECAERNILADQLRTLGMRVTVVDTGESVLAEARQAAEQGAPFELLLIDMVLPGAFTGEEVAARLQSTPATRDIGLAVTTATGTRGDAKRLNEAGFIGYLTRPIPPEHLQGLFARIFATRDLPEEERQRQGPVTRYHAPNAGRTDTKVLVVDDSPIALEITGKTLERLGWHVHTATGVEEALALAEGNEYDVILTDWQLDELDGETLVQGIRSREGAHGRVPVIVLSADSDAEQQQRARRAGADEWLVKPIARDVLQASLARHLDFAPSLHEPADPDPADQNAHRPSSRLVEIFLRELDTRLAGIRTALAGESVDLEAVGRHAHALKGSSRHVGGGRVPIAGLEVENLARDGDARAVRNAVPALEAACEQLSTRLRANVPENH